MNQKLFYIFLLMLTLFSVTYAQKKDCTTCGREITGRYVTAEDKYFHPEHFLCFKCGKPIKSEYKYENGNFYHTGCYADMNNLKCGICGEYIDGYYVKSEGTNYHRDCYEENKIEKCSYCGKPMTGRYIIIDDQKYHDYCYEGNVADKCDVCGGALLKKYITDLYGNKYHPGHESEYPRCDNCKRIICANITGGGVKYGDGRDICNLCYNKSYKGSVNTGELLKKVLRNLSALGFVVDNSSITVYAVDRKKLKSAAGANYSEHMNGYCMSNIYTIKKNGRTIKQMKHTIYVLDKIPPVNIESSLVHELMHVWLHQNTNGRQLSDLREGSCNYLSYLYLINFRSSEAAEVIMQIENDPDRIYGDGFRKVKQKFFNKKIADFFDYLKSNFNI